MSQAIDRRDKILQLIRIRGPVIPSHINKEISLDILFTSAALGELVSRNELKVSNIKIGGTPLYYLPGQEARLQQFANKLNEKDKIAYDILRQKSILRDKELTPLTRVALRNIKDFAKPLTVNVKGDNETFWKWYLLTNDEASKLIKESLELDKQKIVTEKHVEEKPKITESETVIKQIEKPPITEKLLVIGKPEATEELKVQIEKPKITENQKQVLVQKPKADVQKRLVKEKPAKKEDIFLDLLTSYFGKNKIEVLEQKVVRKNSEIEFTVGVPSPVGMLSYYCKAKNKKYISDGDLSSAYLQGQAKKLPILFLTTGQLTKKAKEILNLELKGMSVKII